MNFFPGKIIPDGGRPVADAGFFKAPVQGKALEAIGKDVIVGIRPEDINDLTTMSGADHIAVDTKVEVVEFLGNELQLLLSAGSQSFIARVSTDTQTKPGATLRVGFDTRKMHVFDKQTEVALR